MISTALICEECFQKWNHEGHEYYIQKGNQQNKCSCGKQLCWKTQGNCCQHTNHSVNTTEDVISLIPEEGKQSFVDNIKQMIKYIAIQQWLFIKNSIVIYKF